MPETAEHPKDLDRKIEEGANQLAERNDANDAAALAASRITAIIDATSTAALEGVNKQINQLRDLGRIIERRRDGLKDAAIEHAQFCQDVCQSERIMADAVENLHRSFANGLPTRLRLIDGGAD